MGRKAMRLGRPDVKSVLISIERHICLQSIVHAATIGDVQRISRKLEELKRIEVRDFLELGE